MRKIFGVSPLYFLLSLFLMNLAFVWLKDDRSEAQKIINVKTVYFDEKIYMDIYTNQPLSCPTAFRVLHLKNLTVRNIIYVPKCSIVNGGLRVVYYQNFDV